MATKLTIEYSSLTNGFRTGQRFGQGKEIGREGGPSGHPCGMSYETYTHTSLFTY
jgi:hypothetical protein